MPTRPPAASTPAGRSARCSTASRPACRARSPHSTVVVVVAASGNTKEARQLRRRRHRPPPPRRRTSCRARGTRRSSTRRSGSGTAASARCIARCTAWTPRSTRSRRSSCAPSATGSTRSCAKSRSSPGSIIRTWCGTTKPGSRTSRSVLGSRHSFMAARRRRREELRRRRTRRWPAGAAASRPRSPRGRSGRTLSARRPRL
mmetsp:Transcript_26437/g.105792  ORF Transcript_26437/g.105792 Transcript_26437/m.105792 type:complete len:202 (-) Transcript_26437:331-936(-)